VISIQEAEQIVEKLIELARENPGQPVAIVNDANGGLMAGVMSLLPEEDDWMFDPIPLDQLIEGTQTAGAREL
jgi:hypothetical protein